MLKTDRQTGDLMSLLSFSENEAKYIDKLILNKTRNNGQKSQDL
jgi:hypothetical protein